MEQPARPRGPGRGAARPPSAGPLPRQPGPAGDREAGRRPGRVLDRRVGDPGPPGPAGATGRGHLPRAVLRGGRAAGRAGRALPGACRGARRAHRAGHGVAAACGVAGDDQAPQRPGLGGLAGGRDRHRIGRPGPPSVVVLAGPRHPGHRGSVGPPRAGGPDPRDHDPAAGVGQLTAVGALRGTAGRRTRRGGPVPGPGEHVAGPAGDRVPEAAQPGPARRDPRLVLHVDGEGGGRPPGPGRPAPGRTPGAARRPRRVGQGAGRGPDQRAGVVRLRRGRRPR